MCTLRFARRHALSSLSRRLDLLSWMHRPGRQHPEIQRFVRILDYPLVFWQALTSIDWQPAGARIRSGWADRRLRSLVHAGLLLGALHPFLTLAESASAPKEAPTDVPNRVVPVEQQAVQRMVPVIEVQDSQPATPPPQASTTGFVEVLSVDSSGLPSARPAEVLEQAPGVQLQRLGMTGRFSSVSIRGASAGQVQVFLDGLPLFHPAEGVVNLEDLPLDAIDRVEVYRGASPLAFAADAMGGVVNLISHQTRKPLEARARIGVGSFGDRRFSAGVGGAQAGWQYQAVGGVFSSVGNFPYYSDNGTDYLPLDDTIQPLTNNDAHRASALLRLSRALTPAYELKVQGAFQQASMGVLGLGQGVQTTSARYAHHQGSFFVGLLGAGMDNRPVRLELTLDGFWKEARLDDPLAEVSLTPTSSLNGLQSLGFTGHGTWVLMRPSLPRAGVLEAVGVARLEQSRDERVGNAYGRARAGLGVQYDQLVGFQSGPYLTLQPGMLVDVVQPVGSSAERGGLQTLASPRLGLSLNLTPAFHALESQALTSDGAEGGVEHHWQPSLQVRANGGYFHRLPTFNELYGNQGSVVGNPLLLPEQGLNADAGVQWSLAPGAEPSPSGAVLLASFIPQLRLEVVGFAQATQDLILFVQNSQNTLKPQNIAASRSIGQEITASLTWQLGTVPQFSPPLSHAQLHVQAAYTHLLALDDSGIPSQQGKQLPGRPEHALSLMVSAGAGIPGMRGLTVPDGQEVANIPPLQVFYRLTGRSETALEPSHTLLNPARVLHDLGISWRPVKDWKGAVFSLEVRNLEDTFYTAVDYVPTPQALVDVQSYPLPGRTILFQLGWEGG